MYIILIVIIVILLMKQKGNVKAPKQTNDSFKKEEKLPYKKKKYLLSKAENSFYRVLENAIEGEGLYICPMVRLADIIYVSDKEDRQKYFNKIKSKHIDFLLCNKKYLTPVMAIELDDSSHNRASRIERDDFLNKALEDAGLPILRVKASYSYSPNYIKEKVKEMSSTYQMKIS